MFLNCQEQQDFCTSPEKEILWVTLNSLLLLRCCLTQTSPAGPRCCYWTCPEYPDAQSSPLGQWTGLFSTDGTDEGRIQRLVQAGTPHKSHTLFSGPGKSKLWEDNVRATNLEIIEWWGGLPSWWRIKSRDICHVFPPQGQVELSQERALTTWDMITNSRYGWSWAITDGFWTW